MNAQLLGALALTSAFHCGSKRTCTDCAIKPCQDAVIIQEAVKLIAAGARATLVCQLTKLPLKLVKRLYLMLTGHPSPRGQMPFTDTWYRENDRRMLHATVVWQLHSRITRRRVSQAQALLDVYHTYVCLVDAPLLDITRAFFVLRLVTMDLLSERQCPECRKPFLAPADEQDGCFCPGCRIYFRFRCPRCKAPLNARILGRPRTVCDRCD